MILTATHARTRRSTRAALSYARETATEGGALIPHCVKGRGVCAQISDKQAESPESQITADNLCAQPSRSVHRSEGQS